MDPNQRYPYYRHQQEEEYPEEDEYGYDYQDPSHQRPSFESYWKRSKEEDMSASSSGPRNIRFVETSIPATTSSGGYGYGSTSTAGGGYGSSSGYGSGSGMDAGVGPMDAGYGPGPGSVTSAGGTEDPGEGSSSSARTPQDKAQLRRAQVRKAQIQHRQRKANYVKQLEQDVAHIRDMITTEQHEVQILRDENDVMRTAMGIQSSSSGGSSLLPMGSSDIHPGVTPSPYGGSSSTTQDLDYISMSLALDDVMNRPAYRISGSSAASGSPSYYPTSSTSPDLDSLLGPSPSRGLPAAGTTTMPPPLPDMTSEQTQQAINFILALEHVCWDHFRFTDFQPATNTPGTRFRASGHTMMATSLALRGAPEQVFESVGRTKANLLWSNRRANPVPEDMTTDWQASGLTLTSLYGLACSISDADLEITPVQAWFELAACWPMAVLLRGDVLDRLKKEFVGVVRCPHYGAQIERGAYESIVERVLGPEVDALLAEDVLKLDSARVDSGMGQQIGLAV